MPTSRAHPNPGEGGAVARRNLDDPVDLDLLVRVTAGEEGAKQLRALSESPLRGPEREREFCKIVADIEKHLDETGRDRIRFTM